MDDAKYIFHNTGSPETINRPCGPYFNHWVDLIGRKTVYSRKDIEKFVSVLSNTLQKRILNAREGTNVYICSTSRYSNLTLRRLFPKEAKDIENFFELKEQLKNVMKEVRKRCPDLFSKKSILEKQIRQLKDIMDIYL